VVILHHWNARPPSYRVFGRLFSNLGMSAVVMTLPYHGLRGNGAAVANRFLNADVSNTIRSMMQSVLDVQVVVDWLREGRARQVGVLGISLGSPVAALAASFNPQIRAVALLLTAGDFASVVWSGRATRHIREAMDGRITVEQLQLLWGVISPCRFADRLAASHAKVLVLSGAYDKVVLPNLAAEFVDRLRQAGADLTHLRWPCGHYSLGALPFSIAAFVRSFVFLKRALARATAAQAPA
jgi:acetyl esterase/lipase